MSHKILACAGALVDGLMHATDRCRDANLFRCSRDRERSIHPYHRVDRDDYTQRRACNCICKAVVYHVHVGELDEQQERR